MHIIQTNRRLFLGLAAGGLSASAMPLRAVAERAPYPPDVNAKVFPNGRVRPFAGNTILCHIPQQGDDAACFNALLDVYREMPEHDFSQALMLLPPSSYHMTLFVGANDQERTRASWPADLPLDMPIQTCTAILAERLAAADLNCELPIRMRVDPVQSPTNGAPLTVRLLPLDQAENAKLQDLRRAFATATKIPLAQPDIYRFHVSLGYFARWLTPAQEAAYIPSVRRWAQAIAMKAPVINLGAPEFCELDDMFAFRRQIYLT